MGAKNKCRILAGEPEGQQPLVRSRHRMESDIKMDLNEKMGGSGLHSSDSR